MLAFLLKAKVYLRRTPKHRAYDFKPKGEREDLGPIGGSNIIPLPALFAFVNVPVTSVVGLTKQTKRQRQQSVRGSRARCGPANGTQPEGAPGFLQNERR